MVSKLTGNKLFMLLAVAALAVMAVSVATAAFGGNSGNGALGSTAPREGAGMQGHVSWDIHDRDGNLVASGGTQNDITDNGLESVLRLITGQTAPSAFTNIAILNAVGDAFAADFEDGVLSTTLNTAPAEDGGTWSIVVQAGPFEATAPNAEIDQIVLTSNASTVPSANQIFSVQDEGWTVPTVGSTITFRWTIEVTED